MEFLPNRPSALVIMYEFEKEAADELRSKDRVSYGYRGKFDKALVFEHNDLGALDLDPNKFRELEASYHKDLPYLICRD